MAKYKRPVCPLNAEGKPFDYYESIADAAREYECSEVSIRRSIKYGFISKKSGLRWREATDEDRRRFNG